VIFVETGDACAGMLVDAVRGIIDDDGAFPVIDLDAFFGSEVTV
jgi:hypothetical protein